MFDESSRFEKEANLFAAEYLLNDEKVLATLNGDNTFFSAAAALNVPMELLDFKFRVMKWKGYKLVEPPITARSNFLRDVEVPYGPDDYSC
jgi:Zn-dependent peptidase ImmA (M78 family)